MRDRIVSALAAVLVAVPLPAAAEVAASGDSGFVSHNEVIVSVPPRQAWDLLLAPREWWNGDHSYSGDPANMTLRAEPGGCFCERIPSGGDRPDGEIEHMRVIYAAPYSTLRMSGALGPLQSEALTGVLTVTLAPEGEHTRISWDYVVGGYMRMPMAEMAPLVDEVVGEQLLRLATRLGTVMDPAGRPGL